MASLVTTSATLESATNSDDWAGSTCEYLILRILRKEHSDLRAEIRRTKTLAKLAAAQRDSKHPEVIMIGELIDDLAAELAAHLLAEEHAVFPVLLDLELAYVGEGPISMPAKRIEPLLRSMSAQHGVAGRALTRLRHESNHYQVPAGVGFEHQELYEQLAKLDAGLSRDLRLEDDILFRRATQIERELLRGGSLPGRRQIA